MQWQCSIQWAIPRAFGFITYLCFTGGWLPWAMEMRNQAGLLIFINPFFLSPLQVGQKLYFYCDQKCNTSEIFGFLPCFYWVHRSTNMTLYHYFWYKKSWKHFKKTFLKIWRLSKHLVISKNPSIIHPRGLVVLNEHTLTVCSCSLFILVRHLCMTAASYSR